MSLPIICKSIVSSLGRANLKAGFIMPVNTRAIADTSTERYVYGGIYLIDNPQKVLKLIDRYEGIGANELQPYEYTRELIEVEKNDEVVICWAYLYNWPVSRLVPIGSGDYAQFINTQTK